MYSMVPGQLAVYEQPAEDRWQAACQAHFTSEKRDADRFEAERGKGERTTVGNASRSLGCHHGRRLRVLGHRLDDFLLTHAGAE